MKIFGKIYDDKKVKKIIYAAGVAVLIGWFVFRFVMVIIENHRFVFNPVRDANKNGTFVETVVAKRQNGIIRIPLAVKNNRAFVSANRLGKLKTGQKIGNGKITSVSKTIDFEYGMYVVKTSGVTDGVNWVEIPENCFFVPVYAVRGASVMVLQSGVAVPQGVVISTQDADNACISSGLNNGDVIILSKVDSETKVKSK